MDPILLLCLVAALIGFGLYKKKTADRQAPLYPRTFKAEIKGKKEAKKLGKYFLVLGFGEPELAKTRIEWLVEKKAYLVSCVGNELEITLWSRGDHLWYLSPASEVVQYFCYWPLSVWADKVFHHPYQLPILPSPPAAAERIGGEIGAEKKEGP